MIIAQFQYFGVSHIVAILVTVALCSWLPRWMRQEISELKERRLRYLLGSLLVFAVLMDPVIVLSRWGLGETGWRLFWSFALPLYLCDVVSLVAAYALFTKSSRATEVAYCWGLIGTTQGVLTPTLSYDWNTIDYYNFFLQHGGVPVAAVLLIWGMRVIPQPGAFKRMVLWSWLYMAVVILINLVIDQNYGFLSGKPDYPTMFDYMGPYPYYLITLQLVVFPLYYVLLKLVPKNVRGTR